MKILLALVVFFAISCRKEEVKAPIQKPREVIVEKIEKKPLNLRKPSTGFVEAIEKVEIRARVSGFLEKKLFKDGQKMKTGEKLFLIEPYEYLANVNSAKADLDMARAEENRDKLQYDRAKKLIATNTISESKYDDQKAAFGISNAKVGQAMAKLKDAELNLSYTSVVSPINGVVSDNNYDIGNYVSLESSPLTTVVNSDKVKVNFTMSEKYLFKMVMLMGDINDIGKYTRAVLILPTGEEYEKKGEITFVDTIMDKSTNTIRLKAVFDNQKGYLKDGQYAKIEIETIEPIPSYVIPQTMILVDQQGRYVFVADKDKKVAIKRIETSGNYGSDVLVLNGLSEGDLMIIEGYQTLKPGMDIVVKNKPDNKIKTVKVKPSEALKVETVSDNKNGNKPTNNKKVK